MVVMGVDVGIRVCGFCVCRTHNADASVIAQGEIKPNPKKNLPEKLDHIYEQLRDQLTKYDIRAIVVEVLYSHHKHPTTLGVLAQVRGVVALLAYKQGIGFFEYSPTRARKSTLGQGSAKSEQVLKMAQNLTGRSFLSQHSADAYSLVVAFAHENKFRQLTAHGIKTQSL